MGKQTASDTAGEAEEEPARYELVQQDSLLSEDLAG